MDFREGLDRFAAHQLAARGHAQATIDSYSRDLKQFARISGVDTVGGLSKEAVVGWLVELGRRELSPRSRSRKLSALRAFVAWAMEYGYLDADPVPREVATARALYLPHALTEPEVGAIIAAAKEGNPAGLRDRAILEALYASGMRVSELASLKLLDLHLAEGFALVTGKGGKPRLVPLGQYAIDALGQYLELARGALCKSAGMHGEVFLTRRGPISRATVFRLVKKYAALANIKRSVSPHTFRHSCASHMLAHGAGLRLVQELLGHARLSTTQVYTHIEKSRLRAVYETSHPMA